MYTVDTSRHCVLALFLKQNALITRFCTIIHHRSTGVYAAQLQPRIWVVSGFPRLFVPISRAPERNVFLACFWDCSIWPMPSGTLTLP